MFLVFFLTIASLFSISMGELGHYPFGGGGVAVSLTDLLLGVTLLFLLIWQLVIKKDVYKVKNFKWMVTFWGISLLSLLFSLNLKGGLYLLRFILYSSVIYLGFSLVYSRVTSSEVIVKLIVFLGLLLAILGFLQLHFFPDLTFLTAYGFDPHQNRLTSTFLDPNFMGAFLSISLMLSFYLWLQQKSKSWAIVSGVLLLSIVLTFSRSAYIMLLIEIGLYCAFKWRKFLGVFVVGVLLIYLFVPQVHKRVEGVFKVDASASERIYSWQNGWDAFSKYPILGVGFDNLRYFFEGENRFKVFSEQGGHSGAGVDSSVLFIAATTGIVGLATFLWWLIDYFRSNKRKKLTFLLLCVSIGLLVDSQFVNSLFYPPIMFIYFLLLGANLGGI